MKKNVRSAVFSGVLSMCLLVTSACTMTAQEMADSNSSCKGEHLTKDQTLEVEDSVEFQTEYGCLMIEQMAYQDMRKKYLDIRMNYPHMFYGKHSFRLPIDGKWYRVNPRKEQAYLFSYKDSKVMVKQDPDME